MLTEEFEAGLAKLHTLTENGNVAVMCAEAVPWRCHRSLVADALAVRGARVEHITGRSRSIPHQMTPFADVEGARITYPGAGSAGGRLATRGPFHVEATVRVLQRRPANRVDLWEHDRYLRVLRTVGGLALVEVRNEGTIDEPDVRFFLRCGNLCSTGELRQTLRKVLGLDVDPNPLQRLAGADRRLRPTAEALRGMRPPRFPSLFESFANVVPFQQLSLESGVATVGRLVERFGERLEEGGRPFWAFPTARSIAEARVEELRKCGFSSRKAESLRYIAGAIESGELAEEEISTMTANDALGILAELPGIGPWSASVVLLRGLGRLDVFPPGDVGAERGLRLLMKLGPGARLDRVVERFGAYRGYLYFCALGGSLLAKGLIHAAPHRHGDSRSSPRP
jgi:DNA-3-methyladenine glycosylase II